MILTASWNTTITVGRKNKTTSTPVSSRLDYPELSIVISGQIASSVSLARSHLVASLLPLTVGWPKDEEGFWRRSRTKKLRDVVTRTREEPLFRSRAFTGVHGRSRATQRVTGKVREPRQEEETQRWRRTAMFQREVTFRHRIT